MNDDTGAIMARQPKQKSWWLQNVGTKNGPQCPLCHKHAGCKCKHKEKVTPLTVCCGKPVGKCRCKGKDKNGVPVTPPKGSKPIHTVAPTNKPGVCSCGAYTFVNGRCRDVTCTNH